MASFNKVVLLGNLTRDPELKFMPNGNAVAQLGLAVNRNWTNDAGEKKEEVTFVDINLFGKTAENTAKYMTKGGSVLVEGRLKLDTWEDKTTNEKKSKLKVIGESVVFLGSPGGAGAQRDTQPEPKKAAPKEQPEFPADDVPF